MFAETGQAIVPAELHAVVAPIVVSVVAGRAGRPAESVPSYSSDPVHAYAIDERMKQLGRSPSDISRNFPR